MSTTENKQTVREKRCTRDRRRQNMETTSAQTCDDMCMNDILLDNVIVCTRSNMSRNFSCEVYLSTPSVGYSGSLSTANETNCNKKRFEKVQKL